MKIETYHLYEIMGELKKSLGQRNEWNESAYWVLSELGTYLEMHDDKANYPKKGNKCSS